VFVCCPTPWVNWGDVTKRDRWSLINVARREKSLEICTIQIRYNCNWMIAWLIWQGYWKSFYFNCWFAWYLLCVLIELFFGLCW
jgi:hypothetical protein